ncbi:hypothetical protein HK100_001864, partial [Physocladia obscura]
MQSPESNSNNNRFDADASDSRLDQSNQHDSVGVAPIDWGIKRRGRKATNTEPASKRIAQVRSAARAYRDRKEKYAVNEKQNHRYVTDLEATVRQLQSEQKVDAVELTRQIEALEAENARLRQMAFSFDPIQTLQIPHNNDAITAQQQPQQLAVPLLTPFYSNMPTTANNPRAALAPVTNIPDLDDIFSSIAFKPIQFDTFRQTHASTVDFTQVQAIPADLDVLLNMPLPKPPSFEDVIKPHFQTVSRCLKSIPSLIFDFQIINDLCDAYIRFVNLESAVDLPGVCPATYGEIQVLQGKIIDKCISSPCDLDKVMRLFEIIKKEYSIGLISISYPCNCSRNQLLQLTFQTQTIFIQFFGGPMPKDKYRQTDEHHDSMSPGSGLAGTNGGGVSKSRAGRKPKDTLPSNSRDLKNLQAQRAFRERKQAYIKSLEDEVSDLRARLNLPQSDVKQPLRDTHSPEPSSTPVTIESATSQQIQKHSERSMFMDQSMLIESLNSRILALEAENSMMRQSSVAVDFKSSFPGNGVGFATSSECVSCSVEKMKSLLCMGQIKTLEGKVAELQVECQSLQLIVGSANVWNNTLINDIVMLDSAVQNSSANLLNIASDQNRARASSSESPSDISSPWLGFGNGNASTVAGTGAKGVESHAIGVLSATQLYGPPEIDFAKIALHNLPSLKNSKYVDQFFDTFAAQSNASDQTTIRKLLLKAISIRSKMLNKCNVMDRQKVLEIIGIFYERNKQHAQHRDKMVNEILPKPRRLSKIDNLPTEISHQLNRFKDAALAIPSLKGSSCILDELGGIFSSCDWSSKEVREEKLLQMVQIFRRLGKLCDGCPEDRMK